MITGYLIGDRQLIARLQKAGPEIADRVAATVDGLGVTLARHVVQDFLSGQVLKRRTGLLASSITRGGPQTRSRFERSGTSSISYVGTNVKYGTAWEYGIAAHDIYPVTAKALHFFIAGQEIFAKHVHMPAQAPRAFLKPALEAFKPTAIAAIQKAAREAVQGALKA